MFERVEVEKVLDLMWIAEYDMSVTITIDGSELEILRNVDVYGLLYDEYHDYIVKYKSNTSGVSKFENAWESYVHRNYEGLARQVAAFIAQYDPISNAVMIEHAADGEKLDTRTNTFTPAGTKTEDTAHTGTVSDSGSTDSGIFGFNSTAAVGSETETDGNTRTYLNNDTLTTTYSSDYAETRTDTADNTLSIETPNGTLTGYNKGTEHYIKRTGYNGSPAELLGEELRARCYDIGAEFVRRFADMNFYFVGVI